MTCLEFNAEEKLFLRIQHKYWASNKVPEMCLPEEMHGVKYTRIKQCAIGDVNSMHSLKGQFTPKPKLYFPSYLQCFVSI